MTAPQHPVLADEHLLFSYLDEYLNANGAQPEIVGYDRDQRAFFAWLDEEGGDCVGLRVCVLGPHEGRAEASAPGEIEAPGQGETSSLRYPVRLLAHGAHPTDEPVPAPAPGFTQAVEAVLALMDGTIPRANNHVYEWPEDEADLHRNGDHLSFTHRSQAMSRLRAEKIVQTVIDAMTTSTEAAPDA